MTPRSRTEVENEIRGNSAASKFKFCQLLACTQPYELGLKGTKSEAIIGRKPARQSVSCTRHQANNTQNIPYRTCSASKIGGHQRMSGQKGTRSEYRFKVSSKEDTEKRAKPSQ